LKPQKAPGEWDHVGLGCGFGRRPGGLRQQENIPEVAQRLARGPQPGSHETPLNMT
jgi:hypothetical protein